MNDFALAPMAELSHRALRELIHGFFTSSGDCRDFSLEYFTEMISAPALLAKGPFEKWYLDPGPCPERLVYQLTGGAVDQIAAAAAVLDRQECLGIDINMGCAAPAIASTGGGIRWMEDADQAGRLAAVVRGVTGKRLSVKLRLGPKTAPQNFEYLLRFCRRLEAAGVERITLHPRGGGEKFKRRARWGYVEALRQELAIPVAGNGDVDSAEELAQKAAAGPVMAGRLAVREPWVFAKALSIFKNLRKDQDTPAALEGRAGAEHGRTLPGKGRTGLEETALCFLDLLARYQPEEFHISRARRFFRYYCDNFTWAEYLRNKINREETLSGMGRIISGYCRDHPGEARLGGAG
jgi:tRNA-dihydrouridine synthase